MFITMDKEKRVKPVILNFFNEVSKFNIQFFLDP